MSATDVLTMPWTDIKPPYFDYQLNRYVEDPRCQTTLFSPAGVKQEKLDSIWLKTYPNVSYKNYSSSENMKAMKAVGEQYRLQQYMAKSKFYGNTDDGEKKEKKHVEKIFDDNPRWLLSEANEKEIEKKLNDENSILKPIMTDSGSATFDYESPEGNQVGLVRSSNQSYQAARDKYFIPEQATPDKSADLLQFFKDMADKNPRRKKS